MTLYSLFKTMEWKISIRSDHVLNYWREDCIASNIASLEMLSIEKGK